MKSKRVISKINLNNKKDVNLSLNKFPLICGNFEQFLKSSLNQTFNETRIISLNNISLNKIEKENAKEDNVDKKNFLM